MYGILMCVGGEECMDIDVCGGEGCIIYAYIGIIV